jgi:uncharacterized membrane protein
MENMEEKVRTGKIERNIYRFGVVLLIGEAIFLVVVAIVRPALFGKMLALISASLVGGHLGSIPAGLAMGFRTGEVICFLCLFNLMWLLLFFSLVVKLSDRATGSHAGRVVSRMVQDTHRIAARQKSRVGRFGMAGLAVFVWLPFPWTGSLVGAVIGLLMGMSMERIMLVVVPSMITAITTWTLGFAYVFNLMAHLEKWVSPALAVCVILLAVLLRFRRLQRQEGKQD